ncbi:NEDD4-binding protein 2-like 1 [Osmerus eperlanus]|uniref:NEDD4-binding protein 2-like 1 n=1 Tax=Osmerus eperlanus TaxID=29151 RepID=UPI002E166E8E
MSNKRNKHLIILRGLPGSGKTRLANEILQDYRSGEIYSTDDYFKEENGDWIYPPPTVGERHAAHKHLIDEVFEAMKERVHPIVIDNTNVEQWEMWPYVNMAFYQGYYVLFEDLQEESTISLKTRYKWCKGSISWRTLRNMEERYEYDVDFWSIFKDPEVRNKWMEMDEKLSYY